MHELNTARDLIQVVDLPESLQFLKEGYSYKLIPHELTAIWRKELFNHGVRSVYIVPDKDLIHDLRNSRFALRYPTFSTDAVASTTVQRVKDSAHFFAQGFFGLGAENITHMTTDNFDDPVSWIKPWETCPKISHRELTVGAYCFGIPVLFCLIHDVGVQAEQWVARYIPPIAERFNKLLAGIGFSVNAIRGALDACVYDLAARDDSPWCSVFTAHELRAFE